jgi:hypothetical protein
VRQLGVLHQPQNDMSALAATLLHVRMGPHSMMDTFVVDSINSLAILLYILPTFVGRSKRNANAIMILNILLGWTSVWPSRWCWP